MLIYLARHIQQALTHNKKTCPIDNNDHTKWRLATICTLPCSVI